MIIGISGKISSGKDTIAGIICDKYPKFSNRKFAHKLKEIVAILTNTSLDDNFNNKNIYLKNWQMTLGQMQQKIGTECFRKSLDVNTWIIALLSEYNHNDCWVISDVRFINEIEHIKVVDGESIIIRVNRDLLENKSSRDQQHESETALDNYKDFDYIIDNNETIQVLEEQVCNILKSNINIKKFINKWDHQIQKNIVINV